MKSYTFNVKKPDNLQQVLYEVKREIQKEIQRLGTGFFRGDDNNGTFSVPYKEGPASGIIEGSYEVEEDHIKIIITKTTGLFATENRVKEKFKEYFGEK